MGRWVVLTACVSTLLISGCGLNPEYRAAKMARQDAANDARCKSYGAVPGSQAYIQCRMLQDSEAKQASADQGAAIRAAGLALMNQPRRAAPINCTSTRTGIYTNTNCY